VPSAREPATSTSDARLLRSLALVAAGCVGVALIHVLLRSMVNSGRPWGPLDAWPRMVEHEVDLHAHWSVLARRPMMNHLLAGLATITPWSAWTRFVVAQLAALGWAGIEMMLTTRRVAIWRGDDAPAHVRRALAMFFLYPPVLFAWFRPVYTFDDLLIVALVLRAVRRVIDQRWLAAACLLAIAVAGHEVALFILPSVIWLAWDVSERKPRVAVLLVVPAIAWLVARQLNHAGGDGGMESWSAIRAINFGTPKDTISSIGALILAMGLPSVFVAARTPAPPRRLAGYYVVALALTLPVLAIAAYLRELRLASLAGYLVLPFLVFRFEALQLYDRWQALAAIACGALAIAIYHPVLASTPWVFRIYAGVVVGLFASLGLARLRHRLGRRQPLPQDPAASSEAPIRT